MSHNSSKSRKGGGQAGGVSAAAATRSVAAQAVSAAAATRSDGDNHGDSVRDCDEDMDDGSDSDSSDGQFAGPRDLGTLTVTPIGKRTTTAQAGRRCRQAQPTTTSAAPAALLKRLTAMPNHRGLNEA